MIVDYDERQLDVGRHVVVQIENSSENLKSTIQESFDSIKAAAKQYKVNLDGTVDASIIDTTISDFNEYLDQTSQLATIQAGFLQDYESGALASEAIYKMTSADELLRRKIASSNNELHPDALTRLGATVGLGVSMFGEGFIGFFEDIGDAALCLGSGVTSVLGFKGASEQLKSYSDYEFSKNLIEENDYFRQLNKNSYFDKNSAYANICKGVGKATAAAVTTRVASKMLAHHLSNTGKVANVTEETTQAEYAKQAFRQAKSTVKKVDETRKVVQEEVENVSDHVGRGESIPEALVTGTTQTAGNHFVDKYITKPITEKTADAVLNTNTGQRVDELLRGNGEAIEEHVNKKTRAVVSKATRTIGGEVSSNVLTEVGDALGIDDPVGDAGLSLVGDIAGKVIDNVGTK